jgi:hypothetical protein
MAPPHWLTTAHTLVKYGQWTELETFEKPEVFHCAEICYVTETAILLSYALNAKKR